VKTCSDAAPHQLRAKRKSKKNTIERLAAGRGNNFLLAKQPTGFCRTGKASKNS
jgi:hypothetical protein